MRQVFRKTLRYYGLNTGKGTKRGGQVNAWGVERAFNSFGLYPDRKEIEGAFGGRNGWGRGKRGREWAGEGGAVGGAKA